MTFIFVSFLMTSQECSGHFGVTPPDVSALVSKYTSGSDWRTQKALRYQTDELTVYSACKHTQANTTFTGMLNLKTVKLYSF